MMGDADDDRQCGNGVDDHAAADRGRRFLEFAQAVGLVDHAVPLRPAGVMVGSDLGDYGHAEQEEVK